MAASRSWRRPKDLGALADVDSRIFALELEHKQVRELLAGPVDARDAWEAYLEELVTTIQSMKLARKLARKIPQDIGPYAGAQGPILPYARDPGDPGDPGEPGKPREPGLGELDAEAQRPILSRAKDLLSRELDPGAATSAPGHHSSPEARKGKGPLADPLGSPSTGCRKVRPLSSACGTAAGPSSPRQMECVGCKDSFPVEEGKRAPCGHFYCRDCLNRLCLAALKDRNLIPVQCCKKDFPQEWLREVLDPGQWKTYARILADMSQKEIGRKLDPAYQRWADKNKCKLCPKCGCAIERAEGCNHMTCARCKHQFCFVCGTVWAWPRKCRCQLFPPEELARLQGPDAFEPPRWLARFLDN